MRMPCVLRLEPGFRRRVSFRSVSAMRAGVGLPISSVRRRAESCQPRDTLLAETVLATGTL